MSSPVVRLTVRGVLARKFRVLRTVFAIVLGVAFVSGAFMLTDSVKVAINGLFDELQGDVDLEVRARIAFGDEASARRDPVPDSLVADIATVEGVRSVEVNIQRQATIIKKNGKPLRTSGPSFGIAWYGTEGLDGRLVLEGREARGAGEVAIDKKSAERAGYKLGETVPIVGPNGSVAFTLVGLTGTKTTEGGGGASISAFDPATADRFLGTNGRVDSIYIGLTAGASQGAVQDAVTAAIGADDAASPYEVISDDQSAKETAAAIGDIIDIFGKVLLGFAAISLFVSAFLIFNTFAIIVSQRLRELALLRAIGADIRHIRTMILGESGIIGLLATALGIAGGILVSKGITALFNATGAAFPSASTVISARTIAVSLLVGIGVTLLAAFVPAARAGRIPPVAAMRPEVGFSSLQRNKRLVVATTTLMVGVILFVVGLFAQPGGTVGILLAGAAGAVMIFLGVASLSQSVAAPVSRIVSNILPFPGRSMNRKTPGRIASRNAQRQPRRTASTASALMIGLALVSTIAVVAASVQTTLRKALGTSITADFYVTNNQGFQGLPSAFADELAALPELSAVSPFRTTNARVDGESKSIGAVDPSMGELVNIDIQSGDFGSIADGAVLLHKDPARDLGVSVGDTVEMTWQNGKVSTLTVGAIYADSQFAGNWVVSLDTLTAVSSAPPLDFFIGAKIAEGVDTDAARTAVERVAEKFPSAEVQDRVEFQQSQEDELDQLLFIVYSLLVFAIAIAVLGIANTMALSVFERTHEFGLLRAVGMTRRQLKRSVQWEAIIVSVFGAALGVVVGVPLGIAVSVALPETVVKTVQIPFGTIVTILVASIIVGIIAAIGPARRAAKLDILDAITSV
jgi:putative ABC transport system permease protein